MTWHNLYLKICNFSGDIIVVRYEAGSNGYRVLPITEEEFAIMTRAGQAKTSRPRSDRPRPQPIFPEKKPSAFGGEGIPAQINNQNRLSTLPTFSSKEDERIWEEANPDQKPSRSPIVPAFLRPKVRNRWNGRLQYLRNWNCKGAFNAVITRICNLNRRIKDTLSR